MTAWWTNLSSREKMLIAIAGGLAGILLLSFVVIRPIIDWRSNANQRADAARTNYELVATAAAMSGVVETPSPQRNVPLRQAVTQSAAAANIVIVRFGDASGNQIEIQPAPTPGDTLFQWFNTLREEYGISVVFADLAQNSDGLVNAQVLTLERS